MHQVVRGAAAGVAVQGDPARMIQGVAQWSPADPRGGTGRADERPVVSIGGDQGQGFGGSVLLDPSASHGHSLGGVAGVPRPLSQSTALRVSRQRGRPAAVFLNDKCLGVKGLTSAPWSRHRGGPAPGGRVLRLTVPDRAPTLPPRSGPLSGPPLDDRARRFPDHYAPRDAPGHRPGAPEPGR